MHVILDRAEFAAKYGMRQAKLRHPAVVGRAPRT